MTALLVWMAFIQFNDPDPIYWVVVYLLIAWQCLKPALGMAPAYSDYRIFYLSLGLVAAGLLSSLNGFLDYLVSGDPGSITASMDGPKSYVEPAREFLGLLIGLACLLMARRFSPKTRSPG